MISWSTIGPLLGLDNVLVALALAPLCRAKGRFWLLTGWFVAVEAVAPVAGAVLRGALPVDAPATTILQSALLMTLGLAMLGMTLAGRGGAWGLRAYSIAERLVGSGGGIAALALLLGIDNLFAGAAFSLSAAAGCGLASAFPVFFACLLGRVAGSRLPSAARAPAAAVLLLAAGAIGFV